MASIKEGLKNTDVLTKGRQDRASRKKAHGTKALGASSKPTSSKGLLEELRDSQGKSYPKVDHQPVVGDFEQSNRQRIGRGWRYDTGDRPWLGREIRSNRERQSTNFTSNDRTAARWSENNGSREIGKTMYRVSESIDRRPARYFEPDHATRHVSRDSRKNTFTESVRAKLNKTDGEQDRPIAEHLTTSRAPATPSRNAGVDETEPLDLPISIPYTTAASVFLYGYNSVVAALKGRRRRLYQLYTHPRFLSRNELNAQEATALAAAANVPVHDASDQLELMNKMSRGRPHNGLVLEASRLPAPPIVALGRPDRTNGIIPLRTQQQSAEDVAINGAPSALRYPSDSWRRPFILMLDGILDPENIGSIIRSAHFYGIDAVAIATNTCATLTSATLAKASSGACEAVELLALPQPSNFLYESARDGWRVYAAVAPSSSQGKHSGAAARFITTANLIKMSPLALHPIILVLGAEGTGLRDNLQRRAEYFISIEQGVRADAFQDVGVDSMNVSVAAGVLMESFMRKPPTAPARTGATTARGNLGL